MSTIKQRHTRSVTLRDFLFLFLAHLVGIVELFEKLVRVFDSIDAEIQIIEVLVAGPQPRRFVRRVRTIRRQRKVGLGARDSWSLCRRRRRWWGVVRARMMLKPKAEATSVR